MVPIRRAPSLTLLLAEEDALPLLQLVEIDLPGGSAAAARWQARSRVGARCTRARSAMRAPSAVRWASRPLLVAIIVALLMGTPATSRSSKASKRRKSRSATPEPPTAPAGASSCERTRFAMAAACANVNAKLLEQCDVPECLAAMEDIAARQEECQSVRGVMRCTRLRLSLSQSGAACSEVKAMMPTMRGWAAGCVVVSHQCASWSSCFLRRNGRKRRQR